jgi:hypothetical protein
MLCACPRPSSPCFAASNLPMGNNYSCPCFDFVAIKFILAPGFILVLYIICSCASSFEGSHGSKHVQEPNSSAIRQGGSRHGKTVKDVSALWFKCQAKLLDCWYVSQLLAFFLLWFWMFVLALRFSEWTGRSSTIQCEEIHY